MSAWESTISSLGKLKSEYVVIVLPKIDSTNVYAKDRVIRDEFVNAIVIAETQTHGRGRFNRDWHSPKGGLYFSLIMKPLTNKYPLHSFLMALCVQDSLRDVTGLSFELKWPNDVLIGERKVCGILSELVSKSNGSQSVIIGVGINVNQSEFPSSFADTATSLLLETEKCYDIGEILLFIMRRFDDWAHEDPTLSSVIPAYRESCSTIGKDVHVRMREREITGRAIDIADDGFLIVSDDEGIHHIETGDVIHLRGGEID